MKDEKLVSCDRCGRTHTAFDGRQALNKATVRSQDGLNFAAHYGSDFDGDVMRVDGEIPADVREICDDCVHALIATGDLVKTHNYLGLDADELDMGPQSRSCDRCGTETAHAPVYRSLDGGYFLQGPDVVMKIVGDLPRDLKVICTGCVQGLLGSRDLAVLTPIS